MWHLYFKPDGFTADVDFARNHHLDLAESPSLRANSTCQQTFKSHDVKPIPGGLTSCIQLPPASALPMPGVRQIPKIVRMVTEPISKKKCMQTASISLECTNGTTVKQFLACVCMHVVECKPDILYNHQAVQNIDVWCLSSPVTPRSHQGRDCCLKEAHHVWVKHVWHLQFVNISIIVDMMTCFPNNEPQTKGKHTKLHCFPRASWAKTNG